MAYDETVLGGSPQFTFAPMQQPDMTKVIGVGFQKTGTTSLRDALRVLGYRVGDNNHQMLWPILHGNWARVFRKLQGFDAVEDNPWPLIYKEIDAQIPGCKFILTVREPESWFQSVSRHIGDLRDPMHEWVYGLEKGLPKDHKANTLNAFEAHNAEVREHFRDRPNDLLVIDFTAGAGWSELCQFLGCEVPDVPFPHANNKNKESHRQPSLRRRLKVLKKRMKYAVQIAYLKRRNLLK